MVVLRIAVAAVLGIAVLAVWRFGHEAGCIALVFLPLVALPVALGLREAALLRRRAFADTVFVPRTLLHRRFRSATIPTLAASLAALLAATMLLLDLILEEEGVLLVLAADVPLLILLLTLYGRVLAPVLRPAAWRIVAKAWTAWTNAVLLVTLKVGYDFFALDPPLRSGSGFTTYPGPSGYGHCDALTALLTLRGKIDGRLRVEMEAVEATLPGLMLWIAFLAVSALGAFGFSRYMVEILDWSRGKGS